jgi:phenylacetate-coenzyme A ligase PaaK-like adenylate-forming protein
MIKFDEIALIPPFSLNEREKGVLYRSALSYLTIFHYERCPEYKKILNGLGFDPGEPRDSVEDFPFLPVNLFKTRDLLSVGRTDIVKTMVSSGTTGQAVSKIFLDRDTSAHQTKALSRITADFLGKERLPMLIMDSSEVLRDRNMFSARGAGILGFSMSGRDVTYALDGDMKLDFDALYAFLEKHKGENIFIFGFTFMVWEYFYKVLAQSGRSLPLENGILIHGGGWKKLQAEAVDSERFKKGMSDVSAISRIHNYYGMVEQTGSIFMECGEGRLHCSIFSDVVVRRHKDFSPCHIGEKGLMQIISLLPLSYPGHIILTEDIGRLSGVDDCPCGRLGKTFQIEGRIPRAEVRGCSDTYEHHGD